MLSSSDPLIVSSYLCSHSFLFCLCFVFFWVLGDAGARVREKGGEGCWGVEGGGVEGVGGCEGAWGGGGN